MRNNLQLQSKVFDNIKIRVTDPRYLKILKILKHRKVGSLLEIGCGDGEFLMVAKKNGWDVTGVEISKKAAKRARKKGLNVMAHDANNKLPFKNNFFDMIVAGEVIEHTFDDMKFLNECHRVLKKNGVLVFTTPNLLSLKNRALMLLGFNPRFVLADFHYKVYTKSIIDKKAKSSNFRNYKILGNFVIWSKKRERILGTLFEKWAEISPSLAEHFIVILRK